MIEVAADRTQRDLFPTLGVVARLATLREASVMRIGVAVGTFAEGDTGIAWFAGRVWGVAFLALHADVRSRQGISRLGMVKWPDREGFPVHIVVALLAISAQPPLMRVLVTGGTGLREAEKTVRQILRLNQGAGRRFDMFGGVAPGAGHSSVFAFEDVAGELVIEGPGVPFNESEVFAVVFRVTARTSVARARRKIVCSV